MRPSSIHCGRAIDRGSDESIGLASKTGGKGRFEVIAKGIGVITSHQRDRRTTESATGHAGAGVASVGSEGIPRLDEAIELGTAHLVVVAQGLVSFVEQATERRELATFQSRYKGVHARYLGDGVTGASKERIPQPFSTRLDSPDFEIAE